MILNFRRRNVLATERTRMFLQSWRQVLAGLRLAADGLEHRCWCVLGAARAEFAAAAADTETHRPFDRNRYRVYLSVAIFVKFSGTGSRSSRRGRLLVLMESWDTSTVTIGLGGRKTGRQFKKCMGGSSLESVDFM